MLARGKLSVTPSKERCQTGESSFRKAACGHGLYRPVRCAVRRDIGSLRCGAVPSNTQTYHQSLRTPPTTKRSVRTSTARGEAGISVPHGTWRGGDTGTALHRAVLRSTQTYYQSLTWLFELRPQPKVRTGQYGTRRCGDTGTARYRTALCGTEHYATVPSKRSADRKECSVPASTVARGKKPAVPDGKQQYARLHGGIIYAGRAPAFLDLFGQGFGAAPCTLLGRKLARLRCATKRRGGRPTATDDRPGQGGSRSAAWVAADRP